MSATPLIEWPQPVFEFVEFVGALLVVGAVAFRFVVMGGARSRGLGAADAGVLDAVERRAATIGLVGAAIGAWHLVTALPEVAARRHMDVWSFVQQTPPAALWVTGTALALIGFALALMRPSSGWALAGVGMLADSFRNLATGQWERLLKPLHVFAAGLWIGTLFVLVMAGILGVLKSNLPRDRRGSRVADLVGAFSPLALASAGLLGALGAWLSWRELGRFDRLWTTPYGIALMVKVSLVAVVLALGAYNWRRVKPRLGSEEAARSLLGSAGGELVVATLVVAATAILVSLPAPK